MTLRRRPIRVAYIEDLGRVVALDAEETLRLFRAMRAAEGPGRAAIRARIIAGNYRLAIDHARRFFARGMEHADLAQYGAVGLAEAVDRFDVDRGIMFSTYALPRIDVHMRRAILDKGGIIHVPVYLQEEAYRHRRGLASLRPPRGEKLARRRERMLAAARSAQSVHRLGADADALLSGGEDEPARSAADGEERCLARELIDLLDHVRPREAEVLRLRFGLDGGSRRTLTEIGERLGITRERVRQIEGEALDRLRQEISSEEFAA
jgi:RNA polymerase primary sigma factor